MLLISMRLTLQNNSYALPEDKTLNNDRLFGDETKALKFRFTLNPTRSMQLTGYNLLKCTPLVHSLQRTDRVSYEQHSTRSAKD